MQTAVIYCRVSDKRQVDEGNSLATQEKQAREYVERWGYLQDRVFVERGESAKTDERRVLKEMLAYCKAKAGSIQIVIIPKIDRLARNAYDYASLKMQLVRLGIRVESVGERIEDTPVGRFTEGILSYVAQFDNEIRAERCKGGMVEAVKEGRWVWLAPKGYQNVRVEKKGTIMPHESQADLIREMFRRIAAGDQSTVDVRAWLAAQGLQLSQSRLHEILRNKVYIGYIEAFGLVVRARPPFVPLITEQTFYQAQEAVRRGETGFGTYQAVNPDFPLRGTLVCECGKVMSGCWSQGSRRRYAYYRCTRCPNSNHSGPTLETAFRQELNRFALPAAHQQALYGHLAPLWQAGGEGNRRRGAEIEREVEAEKELRKALALKCAQGIIPDDLAKEQMAEAETRIARLTRERADCTDDAGELDDLLRFAGDFLCSLGEQWATMGLVRKRKLQSFLYPQGIVYRKNGRLRTSEYPVLELLKPSSADTNAVWWTQADGDANALLLFLTGLLAFEKAQLREEARSSAAP